MKQKHTYAIGAGIVAAVLFMLARLAISNEGDMVPYVPVLLRATGGYVEDPSIATESHLDAVQRVLERYGETYARPDRQHLLISRRLSRDQDLLVNWTMKVVAVQGR